MTGLRKRTRMRAGLSLCATAALTAMLALVNSAGPIIRVDGLPVKLVADFPSFAATLLGSLSHEAQDQSLVTSASSSSYLTNGQSDDDLDDPDPIKDDPSATNQHRQPASSLEDELNSAMELQSADNQTTSGSISTNSTVTSGDETTTPTSLVGSAAVTARGDTELGSNSNSSAAAGSTGANSTSLMSFIGGASKKSHIARLRNGQSLLQFCDDLIHLKCLDENAVCKTGACVCKPGFFLLRQSGLCQSISDLLKNCENDYQCQAFDVDLVCDSKSHERSFCDCAEGLYFDQETYSCIPCHRNIVLATNSKELLKRLNQSSEILNGSSNSTGGVQDESATTRASQSLRPCKPIDLAKLNYRRRKQQHQVPYSSLYDQPSRGSSSLSAVSTSTSTTSYHPASSDPFRIKTPLEVFMGAIMLFTLLTVAWFFLQRMIHDCRVILRSLRNPDFSGNCTDNTAGAGSHLTSIIPNSRPGSQLYLDPAGQAVARLLSNDGYNSSLAGIYQRDLAGVMVQHLAANLSPSSTSQALAAANGSISRGENEINLYPLTIGSQQSRSAAAAAAAQLLLSPSHPAIAILRAAAASANHNPNSDYNQTNLLNSMLDPPPKYEEAIAQSEANHPSSYLITQQHDNPAITSRASDDNEENHEENTNPETNENRDNSFQTTTRTLNVDVSNADGPMESNDLLTTIETRQSDTSQPPAYQSVAATPVSSNTVSSTASSSGPSEAEQTNSRRQNSTRRKVTRRSRGDRGSSNRSRQQRQQGQSNQDSDDTLTESH